MLRGKGGADRFGLGKQGNANCRVGEHVAPILRGVQRSGSVKPLFYKGFRRKSEEILERATVSRILFARAVFDPDGRSFL